MRKLSNERIDFITAIRPMSYNVPGHEGRMQALCEKADKEKDKYNMILKIIHTLSKRAKKALRKAGYFGWEYDLETARRHTISDIKKAYL